MINRNRYNDIDYSITIQRSTVLSSSRYFDCDEVTTINNINWYVEWMTVNQSKANMHLY